MKTYGVCNRQSARKHRRAGHVVNRQHDGTYTWTVAPRRKVRPYQAELSAAIAVSGSAALASTIARINTQGAPVDDVAPWPVSEECRAFHLDGYKKIRVGEEWMPKRRNQYTKPVCIRAITPGGMIRYDRGEGGAGQWIEYTQLCGMLGRRVGE